MKMLKLNKMKLISNWSFYLLATIILGVRNVIFFI